MTFTPLSGQWLSVGICATGVAVARRGAVQEVDEGPREWPLWVGAVLAGLAGCVLTCPLWWVVDLDNAPGDETLLPMPAGLVVTDDGPICGSETCARSMTVRSAPNGPRPILAGMVRHTALPVPADDPVSAAVGQVLRTAEQWLGWDGRPVYHDGNAWTPHKALRRVADHLLDHLAELECRLAGMPTVPDGWHGRTVTTDADFARFTEVDLDEATSRLTRLAACYRARLAGLDDATLDARPADGGWPLREIVTHVTGITWYAEALTARS